jgi:hypothetical protein
MNAMAQDITASGVIILGVLQWISLRNQNSIKKSVDGLVEDKVKNAETRGEHAGLEKGEKAGRRHQRADDKSRSQSIKLPRK